MADIDAIVADLEKETARAPAGGQDRISQIVADLQTGQPAPVSEPSLGDRAVSYLPPMQALGVAEQLPGAAVSIPAEVAGGVAGVARGLYGAGEALLGGKSIEEAREVGTSVAAETLESVRGAAQPFIYQPRTVAGQEIQEAIALPSRLAAGAGEQALEYGASPAVATGVQTGLEAASMLLPLKAKASTTPRRAEPAVTSEPPRAAPGVQEAVSAAEREGIRVLTSDVRSPESFAAKWLQASGERIPYAGTGPLRAAQQVERARAVRNVLDEFGAHDASALSDSVMADLLKTRGEFVRKYTDMKGEVISRLDEAGPVALDKTLATVDEQIAGLESLRTEAMQPAIRLFRDFRTAIEGQGLANVERLRRQLGEALNDPNLASVRSEGQKAASKVYSALKGDMEGHIRANGEPRDVTKWKTADKRLAEGIGELESNALSAALKKGDVAPETVTRLLLSKKPSEVRLLYKNLSPQGRANARAAILADAAKAAETEIGGQTTISPDKFAAALDRNSAPLKGMFSGEELARVEGLQRALRLTRRAGEAGVHPMTGAQVAIPVGAAVLADFLGSAGAALAAGGTIGGLARIYESAPVRNSLARLGKTKRGSLDEEAALRRVIAAIQAQQEGEKE